MITEKTYNAVLTEAQANFQARGMSVLNEGFKEIVSNPTLLEEYTSSLLEGASANSAAVMRQLMENANYELLRESSLSGIDPVASLSMPVIRRLWPLSALKDALKTEVAKTPAFVINHTKPYLLAPNGDKHFLPLKEQLDTLGDHGKAFLTHNHDTGSEDYAGETIIAGGVEVFDFSAGLKVASSGSNIKEQPLDRDVKLYIGGKVHRVNALGMIDAGDVFAKVDFNSGLVTVVNTATADVDPEGDDGSRTVDVVAYRSEEYNEQSYSVGFDIARRDVVIPAGRHLNAPLPVEALKDMMALYNIDGTAEAVDIMTNQFAIDLDKEILGFLQGSYDSLPGNVFGEANVAWGQDGSKAGTTSFTFDVRPHAGFAGGPKAWREELKPMIDFLAQSIKNQTYLQNGVFTLITNPLDAQLITNIDWTFRGGTTQVDGVEVDYSVGVYQGANTYRVVSSVLVPQGSIYLIFTPNSEKQMTYKYYPYQFNVEKGYIDANRSRVPSIMMTKRHTFEEYIPAIGIIHILNNTGAGQFLGGPWGNATEDSAWGNDGKDRG